MLLADGGISFFWIGGLFLVGVVALIAVVFRALANVVGYLLRMILGRARDAGARRVAFDGTGRVCAQPRCGHFNHGAARYCARCGTALSPAREVDRHG